MREYVTDPEIKLLLWTEIETKRKNIKANMWTIAGCLDFGNNPI